MKELSYIFDFGMHKGKPFEQVFREDPGYIVWACENTDRLDFVSLATLQDAKSRHTKSRYEGMEHDIDIYDFCD